MARLPRMATAMRSTPRRDSKIPISKRKGRACGWWEKPR
jgi:hypothetical protein